MPIDTGAIRVACRIRLDVQGLRAVAVLAVLLYHANGSWLKADYVGVDVFFVISGFIITALLTDRSGKVDPAAFYASRVKRIVPAYYTMLAVVAALSAVLLVPADFVFFLDSLKSSAWFATNHYSADFGSYFAPWADELPLLHTWSLAIEMQFYLYVPTMLICLPGRWRLPAFALLATVPFAWVGYRTFQQDKAIAERTPGVRFLASSSSSFFAAAPYEHELLIYRDSHHLNEVGASRYGHYAVQQLQRAFDQPPSNVSLKP